MKILFDCRMVNFSGIGRYIKDLLKEFDRKKLSVEIGLSGNKKEVSDLELKHLAFIKKDSKKIYSPTELYFRIPSGFSILHVPHYNAPFFCKCKTVVTVHDLIHIKFPEFFKNRLKAEYAKLRMKLALEKASRIIAISESTKKDLIDFFRINEKKITVIYNGISDSFLKVFTPADINFFKEKMKLPEKYLLTLGIFKEHKNFKRLALAHNELFQNGKLEHKLVFGGLNSSDKKTFQNWLNVHGCGQSAYITERLSEMDLIKLYKGASIIVAASLYEGFGYLAGEALKAKIPLISSNRASLPEVAGPGAILFDPESISEIQKAILKVLDNKEIRSKIVKEGFDHISAFTTEACAKKVIGVYKEVLSG